MTYYVTAMFYCMCRNSVLGFQSIHGVGGSLELATTAKGEPPAHWKQLETLSSSES